MLIGVPSEIKTREYRVGLVPSSVQELTLRGHTLWVQSGAGFGIGISDELYEKAGATIIATAAEIFHKAQLIVKVKEPQLSECQQLREGQILFAYLHLAADPQQAQLLLASGCTAIAYETVTAPDGSLPLLIPMSQVAGRLSIQAGARTLERIQGGRGVLLGGVPGVAPARVTILGGGVVGSNAIQIALGMGADVIVIDKSVKRLQELETQFSRQLTTIYATQSAIEHYVTTADLVIGALLVPGAATPKIITHHMVTKMKKGAVFVDVAIDQGGCAETSRPTTHDDPTFIESDVVHYCVANIPAAVPYTATYALNNVTLPFIIELANKGLPQALMDDPHFLAGLNIYRGHITYRVIAEALQQKYVAASRLLVK